MKYTSGVFENYDHTYKVTHPLRASQPHPDGTRYLGDGAWAVNTRVLRPLETSPYIERAHSKNHVFVATFQRGRADFLAVDPQGEIFDRFSIDARR